MGRASSNLTSCSTNYLGEMMTYGSFALMVRNWLPAVVLAWVWGGLFVVNMMHKEASPSRHPEWARYKERSWWLLPPVLEEGACRPLLGDPIGLTRSEEALRQDVAEPAARNRAGGGERRR
jgi:hypothetical protein